MAFFPISELTIILLAVFFVIWLIVMFCSAGYGKLAKRIASYKSPNASQEAISIVVLADNQCNYLRENIPTLLNQDYAPGFEIIVVDLLSEDDTIDYLDYMGKKHRNLHFITLPTDTRAIAKLQFGIMLGMRSAEYDRILITQADCCPDTPLWVAEMSAAFTPDKNIVLGYTHSVGKDVSIDDSFYRNVNQINNLLHSTTHSAYRCDGTNCGYRKSFFMQHRGFDRYSLQRVGATDILVNHHSTLENTVVVLSSNAFVSQKSGAEGSSMTERVCRAEARHHLLHKGVYRFKYIMRTLMMYLYTLALISLMMYLNVKQDYISLGVVILLELIHICYLCNKFNKTIHALNERTYYFSLPFLLHLMPLWNLTAWLKWKFSNKKVFRKIVL